MTIRATNAGSTPSNLVDVPLQTSFHVPAGQYRATIQSSSRKTRQSGSSTVHFRRILFHVAVPNARFQYLAKLDLKEDLNQGSDLWNVISRLLGKKALQDCSGGTFDMNTLNGVTCDIQIDHVTDNADEYDFPLVLVTEVKESGGLLKSEENETAKLKHKEPTV